MRLWHRIRPETRGSQIAEAALVMPLMFTLLLGIYWFGRAYNVYATITHAAQEGARAATALSCAVCGNSPLTANQVADRVKQTLQASKLDPALMPAGASRITPLFCQCGDPGCQNFPPVACNSSSPQVCVQFDVQLDTPNPGPPSCGVVVSFQYPYQFYLPFTSLNQQLITLKAQSQMRGEY
jgi:Flp pilus assembly protein TadG